MRGSTVEALLITRLLLFYADGKGNMAHVYAGTRVNWWLQRRRNPWMQGKPLCSPPTFDLFLYAQYLDTVEYVLVINSWQMFGAPLTLGTRAQHGLREAQSSLREREGSWELGAPASEPPPGQSHGQRSLRGPAGRQHASGAPLT